MKIMGRVTTMTLIAVVTAITLTGTSPEPAASFDPAQRTSLGCTYEFHYARWWGWGDSVPWKIETVDGLPAGSDGAVRAAANTWTNASRSRLRFFEDADTSNYVASDWVATGARGWTALDIVGNTVFRARAFLNRYYPWSGTEEVEKVTLHEFGHWLFLGDLYGGTGACPNYRQNHPDAVMYNSNQTYLSWDENFGAMWLYGPHYTGWDNNWQWYLQFPDNPDSRILETGMVGLNTFRTRPQEEQERGISNPPPIVWENQVPGYAPDYATDKYYRLSGQPGSSCGHCYAYMKIADVNLTIQGGMRLRWHQYFYWSNKISIDAHFTDGTWLRDYHLWDQNNNSIHPAERPGYPGGQWLWFDVDLSQNRGYGSVLGKTIDYLMIAYDWNGTAPFIGYIDNVNIGF